MTSCPTLGKAKVDQDVSGPGIMKLPTGILSIGLGLSERSPTLRPDHEDEQGLCFGHRAA